MKNLTDNGQAFAEYFATEHGFRKQFLRHLAAAYKLVEPFDYVPPIQITPMMPTNAESPDWYFIEEFILLTLCRNTDLPAVSEFFKDSKISDDDIKKTKARYEGPLNIKRFREALSNFKKFLVVKADPPYEHVDFLFSEELDEAIGLLGLDPLPKFVRPLQKAEAGQSPDQPLVPR